MERSRAVWIVHGDAQVRALLARSAGVPALQGGAALDAFPAAPAPGAIALHVPLAAEPAVAFAHAAAARHPGADWVLLVDPGLDPEWLAAVFVGLRTTLLLYPPETGALRTALAAALAGATPTLAARRKRDVLAQRLARTLGDLELPDPLLDGSGLLCVRGERGTGRLLLARTLHALAECEVGERATFVRIEGDPGARAEELEARLAATARSADRLTVCVEAPERLAPAVQSELAGWVELGPPTLPLDPTRLFWVFLLSETLGSSPALAGPLAEVCEAPLLRIPPFRERPGAALRFAESWLADWYEAAGREPRALSAEAREAIERDPWPGNARELETALRRGVASSGSGPLDAEALGLPAPPRAASAPPPRPAAPPHEAARPTPERARLATLRALARGSAEALAPGLEALRRAGADVEAERLERRLARLKTFAELELAGPGETDVAGLLAALLEERRKDIDAKRLLVLRELDGAGARARGAEPVLRFALAGVIDALLEAGGERGDLYVAVRPRRTAEPPRLEVLLRFRGTLALATDALDLVLAAEALSALGGHLERDHRGDDHELRLDLPAASTASTSAPTPS